VSGRYEVPLGRNGGRDDGLGQLLRLPMPAWVFALAIVVSLQKWCGGSQSLRHKTGWLGMERLTSERGQAMTGQLLSTQRRISWDASDAALRRSALNCAP
jgi:hypothetical protein